jgi:hypothetical protein
MGTRRFVTSLLVCGSLLTGAGCGSGSASGGSFGEASKAMPSGSIAFVDVNIDRDSNGWQNLQDLGSRFQAWDSIVADFKSSLYQGEDGESFKRVEGALGNEAAIAVTTIGDGSSEPTVVGYLATTDDGALRDEAAKDKRTVKLDSYRGYDLYKTADSDASFVAIGSGAALFSNDRSQLEAAIDTREGDADSLADDAAFQAAEEDFSKDALANVWVDARKVASIASLGALGAAGEQSSEGLGQLVQQLQGVDSLTASLEARDNGFSVATTLRGAGAADLNFDPTLLNRVPGTAFAFLTTHDIGPSLLKATSAQPQSAPAISEFERSTGISFADELVPLLSGEQLLYLGPGIPIGGALILHPADTQKAADTMRKLTRYAVAESPGQFTIKPIPGNGEQLVFAAGFSLTWSVEGDTIVLTNESTAGRPADEPITDSSKFTDLLAKAGAPDDANALFYLDTPGLLSLIPSTNSMGADAKAIGGVVAWQEHGSDTYRAGLFLEIRSGGSAS